MPAGINSTSSIRRNTSSDFNHGPDDPGFAFTISNDPDNVIETITPASLDLHITSRIIAGSSRSTHVSSIQAFSTCMSTMDIRNVFPDVYEAKKNRCATTPSLFNFVLETEKHLMFPSKQEGEDLRDTLTRMVSSISAEFQTSSRTNTELILCALDNMDIAEAKCFKSQFHRGISCQDSEFEIFEDECARGMISSKQIDYSMPIEGLKGFEHFASQNISSVFLIRLTTALTDYMAFVSNSDLQLRYTTAHNAWLLIRLASGMKSDQFANNEEVAFSQLIAAADAAQRSVPDDLDRGLSILKRLPPIIKSSINKYSQKKSIPENLMTRDWVVTQVKHIEIETLPKYSWADSTATPTQHCNNFVSGNCTRGAKCKYLHTGVAPATISASLVTAPVTATDAADQLTIVCISQQAPNCTPSFTTTASYWANLRQPDGKPFCVPKSCKPCRDFKKQNASMIVALDDDNAALITAQADERDEPHEFDFYDDYGICMSNLI